MQFKKQEIRLSLYKTNSPAMKNVLLFLLLTTAVFISSAPITSFNSEKGNQVAFSIMKIVSEENKNKNSREQFCSREFVLIPD